MDLIFTEPPDVLKLMDQTILPFHHSPILAIVLEFRIRIQDWG